MAYSTFWWRFGTSAAAAVLVQWPEPASATGAVGSVSPTQVVVSYQHPGETAQSHFEGRKYRICVDFPDNTSNCTTTDNQSKTLSNFEVGSHYRIRVYCHCKASGAFSIALNKTILDLYWHHTAPGTAIPPQIVRLRSVKSGECLYPQGLLIYSAPCGPLSIMRFAIENLWNGHQIRHLGTGRCIHGGFPQPNPMVALATCGKVGTVIKIKNNNNGTYRLDIPTTEDQVFGYPVVKGPGGCIRPSPVQGDPARKQPCHWQLWIHEDQYYFDPA